MSTATLAPAPRPCASCPYRRDVPSGVWEAVEYDKLPRYDEDTPHQPPALFLCHQRDGHVCAGWAACHDMGHTLAVRFLDDGRLIDALIDYRTDVPVFDSGAEAADHGRRDIESPTPAAAALSDGLRVRQARRDAAPEYGLRLPDGRVVVGPGWSCEGDVIAASYPHGRRPGGDLVVRDGDGPWRTVRRLDEAGA